MTESISTQESFEQNVIKSSIPVMVDFWAEWCGPCKGLLPILETLSKKYDGRIKVYKVNVDEAQELANRFSIMSIPCVMLFKGGEKISESIGLRSQADFEAMIDGVIK